MPIEQVARQADFNAGAGGRSGGRRVHDVKRIRLQRKKGWRLPDGAKSVAYPTRWQNPHRKVRPLAEAVRLFREYLGGNPELVADARREIAGHDLACWCPLDGPCHADVWLEIVNRDESG
jgi:hypothetical protein